MQNSCVIGPTIHRDNIYTRKLGYYTAAACYARGAGTRAWRVDLETKYLLEPGSQKSCQVFRNSSILILPTLGGKLFALHEPMHSMHSVHLQWADCKLNYFEKLCNSAANPALGWCHPTQCYIKIFF